MATVHAAVIEHKHGTDLYLAATAARLEEDLFAYANHWWDVEIRGCRKPENPVEVINRYFELVDDEFLTRFGETEVTDDYCGDFEPCP